LRFLKNIPATLTLIVVNVGAFIFTYFQTGSFDERNWTVTVLRLGAQFNPLTLDKEWYRIFTHMFLHGGIVHLVLNMYALFFAGRRVETAVGTRKFLFLYFICGITAALNSLYWNLFTVSVGASGAIFGLFGFLLIVGTFSTLKPGKSVYSILIHLGVLVAINLIVGNLVNADHAAHFGGLGAGILIAQYALTTGGVPALMKVRIEYYMLPVLFVFFISLPRNQVNYFRFFRQVVAAEDSARHRMGNHVTDDDRMRGFIKNYHQWDAVLAALNNQHDVPWQLAMDTFKLRRYISLQKQENLYKKTVVQHEAYVYLDSAEMAQEKMREYLKLDYALWFRKKDEEAQDGSPGTMVKVLYDSQWVETPAQRAVFYRVGFKDSLGRWNGPVRDFYNGGDVQMKGMYKGNKRDGVFLYYSDRRKYISAGRYVDDKAFGKWQTFHENGRLASEVYYNNSYFVKNLWDSLGNQLVVDGNGREIERYPNGVIATEGEYHHGLKDGYWYGRHPDGSMYYEEHFSRGRLLTGRSRTLAGETFIYDESSLFPMPEGGFEIFSAYLKGESKESGTDDLGHVKLSFRVTSKGQMTDITIDQSATPALDARAKQILLNGPRWLPARNHGHDPVDAYGYVQVEFY
jgi:membrane associated rhomboid family serine protease/antitoxin component YwqK of YwqJK toxin-antitoxin module